VLSGDKQRISRGYDFTKVCQWLASRCDLILLLFDAHKLDISDEFKEVIEAMKGDSDKCRCVLNKADEIDGENLVKVYGALMWNLGKILWTPEVSRMYIGSFWDQEYKCTDLERLLNQDRKDLVQELRDLPRNVCVRRVNEVVARARALKVHFALGAAIKARLPTIGGCGRRQRRTRWIVDHLPEIYAEVMKEYSFAPGDMPPVDHFRERLRSFKEWKFQKSVRKQVQELDKVIQVEVPRLMAMVGCVSASELGIRPKGKDVHHFASKDYMAGRASASDANFQDLNSVGYGSSACQVFFGVLMLFLLVVAALHFSGRLDEVPEELRPYVERVQTISQPLLQHFIKLPSSDSTSEMDAALKELQLLQSNIKSTMALNAEL